MEAIRTISSKAVVLDRADVDTDQIIPAQHLTTTSRDGLGRHLFGAWRGKPDRSGRPFPLDDPAMSGRSILVAGANFGCGSSREHAVWALMGAGFKAVLSSSIADIFASNAARNGLLAATVDDATLADLMASPDQSLAIDIESMTITRDDGSVFPFTVEPFARHCILNGVDEIGYLLSHADAIEAHERSVPCAP